VCACGEMLSGVDSFHPYNHSLCSRCCCDLVIKVRVVGIVIRVDIIVFFIVLIDFALRRVGLVLLMTVMTATIAARSTGPIVIRSTASHNGLANPANPIVLLSFRVGIQEVLRFGRANFKRVSLLALQISRFDRGAVRQIHHTVRGAVLVFGKE